MPTIKNYDDLSRDELLNLFEDLPSLEIFIQDKNGNLVKIPKSGILHKHSVNLLLIVSRDIIYKTYKTGI